MEKETFIVRTEWMDAILDLSPSNQATIFCNLFYYHADKDNLINLKNPQVKVLWKIIEPSLRRNISRYDKRIETSKENGKMGGRPPKPKKPNSKPNNLNNPDSVSVSDSDSDKEINSFDLFWELYDKKTGRPKAEQAWKKLSEPEKVAAMAYIPLYKTAQPDKKFRKNAQGFLNQKGWEDEIITAHSNDAPAPMPKTVVHPPEAYEKLWG